MSWLWKRFLDHAKSRMTERLALTSYPIPAGFEQKRAMTGPRSRRSEVTTTSWAVKAPAIRQARAACVEAEGPPHVLNFVINPDHHYDLPFFGADLVSLPGGHLIALDLQPVLKRDASHTAPVWKRLQPVFEHWRSRLPDGGPIPQEAEPYFSKGFLWTRLPLDDETSLETTVFPAFVDYLEIYLDLVCEARPVQGDRSDALLAGQRRYTDYRSEKDPARGMLTRFYGSDWTEAYIHGFLFDLESAQTSSQSGLP